MRAPAVLLAIPLTVGCAFGLVVGERAPASFAACAAAAAFLALLGGVTALASDDDRDTRAERERAGAAECTVCLVVGALVVGISSGADAARRAYRSPLFVWFEGRHPGTAPSFCRASFGKTPR